MKFDILVESIIERSLPTITVLYDYVKDKPVYNIPIEKVIHELVPTDWEEGEERPGTEEFISRANKSDLTYPIIVYKNRIGELLVIDGVHRIGKANESGHKHIKGHILSHDEAIKFKWKDHNGIEVGGPEGFSL